MTYLQLVNAVLKKLRKDQVTTFNETTYSTLIGEFINEAKQEIEDSWNWTALRSVLSITTAASDNSYTISGTNDRTVIISPMVNDTNDNYIYKRNWQWMQQIQFIATVQEESPVYWAPNGQTSDELDVLFYPTPNAVETIRVFAKVPQDDFSADATELTIPDRPVILGAYMRAIDERGEDGGTALTTAVRNYERSWGDAIVQDVNNTVGELDWVVH